MDRRNPLYKRYRELKENPPKDLVDFANTHNELNYLIEEISKKPNVTKTQNPGLARLRRDLKKLRTQNLLKAYASLPNDVRNRTDLSSLQSTLERNMLIHDQTKAKSQNDGRPKKKRTTNKATMRHVITLNDLPKVR